MPIYEYRCENGHLFEVMQRISDPPSGFYNTDYGTSKRKRETDKAASSSADSHDAKQSEKKSESKPASSGSDAA